MGRAARRRRQRAPVRGPLEHTGPADQLAGARWARADAESLTFYAMPWPVWGSASFLVLIGVWVGISAWLERNPFGVAGLIFFGLALWTVRKAPRERTVLERGADETPGALRIDEGILRVRTRRRVPFDEIDAFAIEHNRHHGVFRVVAVAGDERVPVGRSFVHAGEAGQRIGAIADWLALAGPPVDRRLERDLPMDDDED